MSATLIKLESTLGIAAKVADAFDILPVDVDPVFGMVTQVRKDY